jgi:hypothetical protein
MPVSPHPIWLHYADHPRLYYADPRQVLRAAAPGVATFYEKIGFVESKVAMERPGAKTSDI